MINLKNLRNKKVGVLGLEKTGLSVVNAVRQAGGLLICWDDDKEKRDKLTQSSVKNKFATGLTLSEEDALRAQISGCWSIPLGLPYDENLLVRIKLNLKKDGTILKSEILDHERMNKPGQNFYRVLAESALRAVRICQPLKVPPTGYEKWKDIQLNFNPTEMLKG